MKILKKIVESVWKLVNEYPAVFSAIVIYLYYLVSSVDYFEHAKEKKNFLDYLLQFDALIWMWLAAVAFLQVQKYRKRGREETQQKLLFQNELQIQQIQNDLLNDVTALLQDSINNPLAIISLKMHEIRNKFEPDSDLRRTLESIERALRKIEHTIRDLKGFQMQKMIKESGERLSIHPTVQRKGQ